MIIYTEYFNFKPCVVYADSKMRFKQKKNKTKKYANKCFYFLCLFLRFTLRAFAIFGRIIVILIS